MSVKDGLTPNRPRRQVETETYAAFARRVIRGHGRRVADADPEDLAQLLAVQAALDEAIRVAVQGQRANGFSWAQIARGIGTTRQAAQQRWGQRAERQPEQGQATLFDQEAS